MRGLNNENNIILIFSLSKHPQRYPMLYLKTTHIILNCFIVCVDK